MNVRDKLEASECKHIGHKPCRARDCFFYGMDHCHSPLETEDG